MCPSASRSILIEAASTAVFIALRVPRTVISASRQDWISRAKFIAKVNAPELLRRELSKASYVPEPLALGVNTDAYQPCERELRLTRRVLEVLRECEHPVALITKSSLIERDIDLLAEMASRHQAMAAVTHHNARPGNSAYPGTARRSPSPTPAHDQNIDGCRDSGGRQCGARHSVRN